MIGSVGRTTASSSTWLLAWSALALLGGCAAEDAGDTSGDDGRLPSLSYVEAQVTDLTPSTTGALLGSFSAGQAGPGLHALRAGLPLPSGAARVGVLWVDIDRAATDGPYNVLQVQELVIRGMFPSSFSIDLSNGPSQSLANRPLTGSMVLVRDDASFNVELRPDYNQGSVMPRLSEADLDTLGIVSIPPVYITYVPDLVDGTVINLNFDSRPLAPGYHLGLFDGELINADQLWYDCVRAAQSPEEQAACGVRPYDRPGVPPNAGLPTRIDEGDVLAIEIGGPDDLILVPWVE